MTDNELTLEVLKNIRDDVRGIRSELQATNERLETGFAAVNQRVDRLTDRVEVLTDRVENGFADVNRRLDGVLAISGGHHTELESRVRRIEDHLGLTTG